MIVEDVQAILSKIEYLQRNQVNPNVSSASDNYIVDKKTVHVLAAIVCSSTFLAIALAKFQHNLSLKK